VTESVISRIGKLLPINLADHELVRFGPPVPRAADVRFSSRYFLRDGAVLYHGDELVSFWLGSEQAEVADIFAPESPHRGVAVRRPDSHLSSTPRGACSGITPTTNSSSKSTGSGAFA